MFDLPIYIDPSKKGKKATEYENWTTFVNIFEYLQSLALERYDIEGVPETCDKRVMKLALLWYGSVCVYSNDGSMDADTIISLPATPNAKYTIYGNPASCFVYSKNGMISKPIDVHIPGSEKNKALALLTGGGYASDGIGVMLWENDRRFPFIRYVWQYAKAMADCLRTIDVARRYIKVPVMVVAKDNANIPTIKKYFEAVNTNEPVVVVSESLRDDDIQIVPITTASEGARTALELYTWYQAQFLTLCGYNSSQQLDKKGENLISEEVEINEENEDANLNKIVGCLQFYLDVANDYLGTNMRVTTKYMNEGEEDENDGADYQGSLGDGSQKATDDGNGKESS